MLIFLLTSTKGLFRTYAVIRTYMDDAGGIADGSVVRLNGITVGYLDRLTLTTSRDPNRTVEFDMKVKPEFLPQIPVDSVVGIAAANVLGDKFLNITKGSQQAKPIHDGGELTSVSTKDIGQLMAAMGTVLTSFQGIVTRVDNLMAGVESGKGNIGLLLKDDELYRRLNSIASEGQLLIADVRKGNGSLSKFMYDPEFYNQAVALEKRLDGMLADLQAGQGTAGKFLKDPALYDEAQKTVAEIRAVVAQVNSGKGTAGALLKDDAIARHLDELVNRFNTTMDKINSGQGTVGQLMVNPQLYEALTGATTEFQSLAKDIRANPKKFLTIRLALF
ncbi:Mammalian cell entry related domain protein [Candidatus Sulfopaludibacter sp. SbA3]|nr:Mammalian cell entry related domain protein [Candidatus Sulfopaludibacter sp. SbA3]